MVLDHGGGAFLLVSHCRCYLRAPNVASVFGQGCNMCIGRTARFAKQFAAARSRVMASWAWWQSKYLGEDDEERDHGDTQLHARPHAAETGVEEGQPHHRNVGSHCKYDENRQQPSYHPGSRTFRQRSQLDLGLKLGPLEPLITLFGRNIDGAEAGGV